MKLASSIIPLGAHFSSAYVFSITLLLAAGNSFSQRPAYRSQKWTVSFHPEGKRYAHYDTECGMSVVTEAYVTERGVAEQLEAWLATIRALAAKENVHILQTTDLFLEIDQDSGGCSYWFADHAQRTVFWLHDLDTNTSGLPDSCSEHHRRESYAFLTASSELNYSCQNTLWKRITGPMSRCSLPPLPNILRLP